MSNVLRALCKKILGLALIFNSIVSLISAANILYGFYQSRLFWQPYSPYLIEGSLFWFVILTSTLNLVPAKLTGKVDLRRFLFHHYVYGFLVILASLSLIVLFMPACIFMVLEPSIGLEMEGFQSVLSYAILFFIYGGLTLIIDDIYDISMRVSRIFDRIKTRMQRLGRMLQTVHLCSSVITIYIAACVAIWCFKNYFLMIDWPLLSLAHIIFTSSMLVNSFCGLKAVKERMWFTRLISNKVLTHKRVKT